MIKRAIVLEERADGKWDVFIRNVDTQRVMHFRHNHSDFETACVYANGLLDGISFHTSEIVSHGILVERLDDK